MEFKHVEKCLAVIGALGLVLALGLLGVCWLGACEMDHALAGTPYPDDQARHRGY